MGNYTSKNWEEMTEMTEAQHEKEVSMEHQKKKSLREKIRTRILRTDPRSASEGVDRTPIAVERQTDPNLETPAQARLKILSLDPRSPGGEVERTPIVVEEPVRRRLVDDECSTPLRGHVPPSLTIPGGDSIGRSPLLIDNGEEDPRSPSTEAPRTPIYAQDSPLTIDLGRLQIGEKEKRSDRGQPSQILQNRLRTALQEGAQGLFTPPSAGEHCYQELESEEDSIRSSNDSSLVI